MPVLTREECSEQPGASIPTGDQLCAGLSNSRQSSCPGDSGGGLMIRGEDYRWSIIGIVSTGQYEWLEIILLQLLQGQQSVA